MKYGDSVGGEVGPGLGGSQQPERGTSQAGRGQGGHCAREGGSGAVSLPGLRPEQADLLGPTRTSHSSSGHSRAAAASAIATSSNSGSTSSGVMSSESGSKGSE
jgi:hypothetical protein